MQLIREMTLIKDKVTALLTKHPHLRDSDNKLIATIWKYDLMNLGLPPNETSAQALLTLYSQEKITNAETIRRVRQKIQEEDPTLRGTSHEARQEQGDEVRLNINPNFDDQPRGAQP